MHIIHTDATPGNTTQLIVITAYSMNHTKQTAKKQAVFIDMPNEHAKL